MKYCKLMMITSVCIFFMAGVQSCKKSDSGDKEFDQELVLKQLREKIAKQGYHEITQVNKRSTGVTYTDVNGMEHEINLAGSGARATTSCTPGLFDCATATDVSELESPVIDLLYGTRISYCYSAAQTSDVTVRWRMSVPYTILPENPFNTAQKSRGRLRFKNSSNQIIQSYLTIVPVTIVNWGVDPDCSNRTVFEYSYTLTGIPNSLFTNGNSMESNYFLYTNCSYQTTLTNTAWITTISFTGTTTAASPCGRTDKVWINPGTGPGGVPTALGVGNTIGCSFPTGYVAPQVQRIEYWKNSAPGIVYVHEIGPFGAVNMTNATPSSPAVGWTVRYQNKMNTPTACVGPWYIENWVF
jgi:hypothetical protein